MLFTINKRKLSLVSKEDDDDTLLQLHIDNIFTVKPVYNSRAYYNRIIGLLHDK